MPFIAAEIALLDRRIAADELDDDPQVRDAVCVMFAERERLRDTMAVRASVAADIGPIIIGTAQPAHRHRSMGLANFGSTAPSAVRP